MASSESVFRNLISNIWDYSWRTAFLLRQPFRVALQLPGITVTVIATVTPFLPLLPEIFWIRLLAVVGLVPLLFVSGLIGLWKSDPETYARALIAGRPAKEVLFLTSWHIVPGIGARAFARAA